MTPFSSLEYQAVTGHPNCLPSCSLTGSGMDSEMGMMECTIKPSIGTSCSAIYRLISPRAEEYPIRHLTRSDFIASSISRIASSDRDELSIMMLFSIMRRRRLFRTLLTHTRINAIFSPMR